MNLFFQLVNKSSLLKKGLQTNQVVAPSAERSVSNRTVAVSAALTARSGKCMTLFVQLVELKPRYLSVLVASVLFTAVIVSKIIADINFEQQKLPYFLVGEFLLGQKLQ